MKQPEPITATKPIKRVSCEKVAVPFFQKIEILGELSGQQLLHLQCNAGQDTLSLAQRGAVMTGVDISDEAIMFAQQLSIDTGIAATFVRADIFDWLNDSANHQQQFDIVFSSYGAVIWLSGSHQLGYWYCQGSTARWALRSG